IDYLKAHPGLQGIIYWVAAFGVGLFAVGYAWVFAALSTLTQKVVSLNPAYLLALTPATFLLAWWLCWRFAPGAAGGGIPEVLAAMGTDPQKASIWTGARAGVVKFFSSLSLILGGGAIGREGPTIQIAASIF